MSKHALVRLAAIRKQLLAAYEGCGGLSSATKGRERELFVNLFLRDVFPPQYRFASGEITDRRGGRTGQLDIVAELPFFPSLPLVGVPEQRLYFLESVCAVIEVKSDLSAQWNEVENTWKQFQGLVHGGFSGEAHATRFGVECIAFCVVGFSGWKTVEPIKKRCRNGIGAILQIDPPYLVCPGERALEPHVMSGDAALGRLIAVLNEHLVGWQYKRSDLLDYFQPGPAP